ncbi:MAG: DUF1559 domain-containing protein [Verrucomicrobiae bacterium]|nr:DUF1559 domain-containing protein [Verrucomicrobiae bacterium]
MKFKMQKHSAFTLTELLVVITILSMLCALLAPALAQAREKARQIVCINNLKQCGLGLMLYTKDNEGWIPSAKDATAAYPYWHQFLVMKGYLNDYEATKCPSSKLPKGYSYNSYGLLSGAYDSYQYNLWNLQDPAARILLGDSGETTQFLGCPSLATSYPSARFANLRHSGTMSGCFADGSVRVLGVADLSSAGLTNKTKYILNGIGYVDGVPQ